MPGEGRGREATRMAAAIARAGLEGLAARLEAATADLAALSDQIEGLAGGPPVQWTAVLGKPASFPPSSHTHPSSEVPGLDSALAGKEPADAAIQGHIGSPHAPADAQRNADITKSEIEARLTGQVTSHTHPSSGSGPAIHKQALEDMAVPTGETAIVAGPVTIPAGRLVTISGTGLLRVIV